MSDSPDPRTVIFKAFYWNYEEAEEGELLIHIGGKTANNETVHCIVENFTPYVYLELPKRIKWNRAKCTSVFQYFQKVMKSDGPISYWLAKKYKMKHKEIFNCMCLTFPSNKAIHMFGRKCHTNRTGMFIDGVGNFRSKEFIVHEMNIDPVVKFTASKKLKLASWIEVKETIQPGEENLDPEDRMFSSADIDLRADWQDVAPYIPKNTVIVRPKYFSFDIECNSKNHNSRLPDPDIPENVVFQIAVTIGYLGEDTSKSKKYLFSFGNPHDQKEYKTFRCKDEKDVFMKFKAFIDDENPDVFIGYNTMKFDWNYMIARLEKLGIYNKFAQISRIIGAKAALKESSWSSSAYGEQKFRYLDPMGRTNVDVLLEIERNYKLPQYGLNAVSEYFLKESKDDITPRQLFMLFQLSQEMTPIVEVLPEGVIDKETRIEIKKQIQEILQMRRCHGEVRKLRTALMNAKTGEEFNNLVREALTLTGKYCVQDTVLPVRLCNKLDLWTTMEEMSNCMNVPMSYLHTRGQQVKVVSQVYRETIFADIVIPYREKLKDGEAQKYQGAIVIEANPGDYENVACFDFASLYPSIMITYNICHTTNVADSDPIPDELCHVLEWDDHVGCPHDKQKRKRKKEDILCKHHRYRFKKVIMHPDGTREGEGIMAKLVRNLLAERKLVKKEMAKLEAKQKMALGLATPEDLEFFAKMKWEIIEKGSLTKEQLDILEVEIKVLNAKQLALKVSANSSYGTLGAQNGPIPLVEGAATVTAQGRWLITEVIAYILRTFAGSKLVYGDTDSAMMTFPGKSTAETFAIGDTIAKAASHYLKCKILGFGEDYEIYCPSEDKNYRIDKYPRPKMDELDDETKIKIHEYDACPVNLEFENLYKRYLLLSKKRYVTHAVNRKGEIVGKIKKGVVLARRDNCVYLRNGYKELTDAILEYETQEQVMNRLYDHVHKLFTRQIPDANLIIYMGVKTIMNYAKRKETKQGRTVVDRIFIDSDGDPIDDPFGPLDPRLEYPNLPQVLLALKMMRRGDDVPPNTRLEFLYLQNEDATHQGEKAEDYTYYRENKDIYKFKPDQLHYIEKQLSKPFTELLEVKYPSQKILYEPLDDALERCIQGLDELNRHRVKEIKTLTKTVESVKDVRVGWSCKYCKKCKERFPKQCSKHKSNCKPKEYLYKGKNGMMAKVQYILESAKRKKLNKKAPNEIDEAKYPELLRICRLWKSRYIMNQVYAQFGLRKRANKRPTQTGQKLRIKIKDEFVKVMLTKKIGAYSRGDMVTLKDVSEEVIETSAKKAKRYVYTIELPDGTIKEKVPREAISTWRLKDGTIMKDILIARGAYKCVVKELDNLFNPFNFVGKKKKEVELFEVEEDDDE